MVWMCPQRLAPESGQISYINKLLSTHQSILLNDYVFDLGCYIFSADTHFALKNNGSQPAWVENIRITKKYCQAPLTGTLINAPYGVGHEPRKQFGIDLDSPNENVKLAHPVLIKPGATRRFNIRAEAPNEACSFWYQATVLYDGKHFQRDIGNEPFRVSGFSRPYLHAQHSPHGYIFPGYEEVYVGGSASPARHGRLVREISPPRH
jgi:hypothetical protein